MQHNVLRTNRGYAGPVTNGLRAYKGAQAAPKPCQAAPVDANGLRAYKGAQAAPALPPVDANGLRTYKGVRA